MVGVLEGGRGKKTLANTHTHKKKTTTHPPPTLSTGTTAWLVNTGWSGGAYGTGDRIKLRYTRAILDAIHSGELSAAPTTTTPVFGLHVPTACTGVPSALLNPRDAWEDVGAFDGALTHLGEIYAANFAKYADGGGFVDAGLAAAIVAAGPELAAGNANGANGADGC